MGAESRLVAKRPKDDAWMVSIAHDHPLTSRQPCGEISAVVAQRRVVGVRLDVRLRHHVQAELVTEIEECWIVRIVTCADRIAVVAFHCNDVVAHVFTSHCLASFGVMILPIDTAQRDTPPVHAHLTLGHLDAAKTRNQRRELASLTHQFDHDAIPIRILGRPRSHPRNLESGRDTMSDEHVLFGKFVRHLADHGGADALTRQLLKPDLYRVSTGR